MAARQATPVEVGIVYGLGARCSGRFARRAVQGLSAGQIAKRVTECPQARGAAARTAQVLGEVLRSSRKLDVELVRGSGSTGKPIALDDVVVRELGEGEESDTGDFTIMISESYRGGHE